MQYQKRAYQMKQGFKLWRNTPWRNRSSVTLYLGSNILSRTLGIGPRRRELNLQLSGLNVTCLTFSAHLGAYVDIFLDRIYEKVLGFTPQPGNVVFDLGANIGFYTLMAARAVGPSGHVYSFEPNPRAFKLLTTNVQSNGLDWVNCYPYAVADRDSQELRLWASEGDTSTGSLFYDKLRTGETTIGVPAICLDDFVEQNRIRGIDLLKMDTEGSEALIAQGGLQKALLLTRRIVMESHNTRYPVRDLIEPLGFEMVLDDRPTHTVYFEKRN